MTTCRVCHWKLREDNWYKSSQDKDDKICKRCRSIGSTKYRKEYYINNKDRIAVKNLMYRLKQKVLC